jgi:hypothetical protein
MVNVIEMVHREERAKEYALSRARLLSKLTKGKTFRPIFDLFIDDAIYLANINTQKLKGLCFPYYSFQNNYNWIDFNSISSRFKSNRSNMINNFLKELNKSNLNKNDKKYWKKYLFKRGKLTSEGKNLLIASRDTQITQGKLEAILEDFTSIDVVAGWMMGELKDKDFLASFYSNLTNIENFVDKVCDYIPECREQVVNYIKYLGGSFLDTITDLENNIEKLKSDYLINYPLETDQLDEKLKTFYKNNMIDFLKRGRTKYLKNMYQTKKHKIRAAGLKWNDWENYVINSELGQVCSLDLVFVIQLQLYLDKITGGRANISASDGPDIHHFAYSPYCDIFRADKRTVSLYNKVKSKIQVKDTKILSKTEELPDAIIKLAYEKGVRKETIPSM